MGERMPIGEQVAYFNSHTPRILAGLTAKRIEGEFPRGGHGEPIGVAYEVVPSGKGVEVLATRYTGPDGPFPGDPIHIRQLEDSEPKPLFVSWQDGYDGEFGHLKAPDKPEPVQPYVQFLDGAALIVVFHYPDDLFDMPGDTKLKAENLFTWITFIGRNSRGDLTPLFDFECA